MGCAGRSAQSSPNAPGGGTKSGPLESQRKRLWGSRGLEYLVQKPTTPPSPPANPQHEASAQGPAVPGAGPQGLKFHTHLSASIAQLENRGRQETREGLGVFSLPRSAPAVSTLVTGNNPERVSKARRNSDIVVTPGGSLRRRLLGCTLGPAAAAAAPSPEPTSVIYKCHWKFFSSMSPASSPSPAWSRMWKVYGCARVGERVRVSASEPLVCLDFSMQGTSDLTSRKEGQ